ncbi:hypothetical protein AMES_1389 [Amycolatopsis mediterranei S699]|uniref:Uncharacterized protein n=2 Tax=Amycolatopsis mediterranei TaxID=33910 RepID=A0A0H3CX40_AMYMU|nr:hypothetical protein [Amycolatopsis mediterranei]ADJ43212.1 hypothetical protein AMED_1398 [Amycolatopsis mediterranei U32]AEK39909.1 hypothetical protein RAM_07085 [Amycolatopsis mediterranei S699]AFO74925.1 hypothetical protein AMES_1389 [Amycolatopsis mediterranei S699]AGT82054.1 hypothetical protein B737_1390 [Amycolatopsis mediterranei RB]KDO05124.1 hypothetical protein DV26_40990 [Amycolatopsis mediterranei]
MTFMPLPDRAASDGFPRCLAELVELCRVHLPARTAETGEDEWDRRIVLRSALGYRNSDYPDLPEPFFAALVRAAVHDPNPSFNRQFVEPLRSVFGARRTQEALLAVLTTGTNPERAGAARAWYWATLERLDDLQERWNRAALREFVANDDLDVRRCVLPGLTLDPARYPAELRPLVAEAVHLARTHPDDYLGHRVEIQVAVPED